MTYVVVDASVWVARLVVQDIFFQKAKAWMDEQRSKGVIQLIPALLLAEVAGAISRQTGDVSLAQKAIEQIQHLPGLRIVEMDRALSQAAAQTAARLGLRGAGSFYVALAEQLKVPLATLDKDQYDRSGSAVPVVMI